MMRRIFIHILIENAIYYTYREAALAPVRDLNLNDGVQEGDGVPSFHTTLRDVSYADIDAAYKYLMET